MLEPWAVAAALLLRGEFDGIPHIEELTDAVLRTGLTTLGLKGRGGTRPRQTLSAQISKLKGQGLFIRPYRGLIDVGPKAKDNRFVKEAIEALEKLESEDERDVIIKESDYLSLQEKLKTALNENEKLRSVIKEISRLSQVT
jgi:hypothetical protein